VQVGGIDVTLRQLSIRDKQLSRELSSSDVDRFCAALERLIDRQAIRHGGIQDTVQAMLANRNAEKPVETIVLSSTHRLAENVSEKLHEAYKKASPEVSMAQIAALKPKKLQPAELLSTASSGTGEMIEYQPSGNKPARMGKVLEVRADGAQGASKTEMIRVEDNRSLLAIPRASWNAWKPC
jgi:hypothetical protein